MLVLCTAFPDSSVGKESTCNAGDLGSIPGLGKAPGEGKGYPLQYFGVENSMVISGGQSSGASASASVLPMNVQD